MEIYKYPERYVIVSLSPDASLPPPPDNGFYTCIRDKREVTLVLPEAYAPANATRTASGYRVAILDTAFALDAIGILAKCSAALAQVGIPIWCIPAILPTPSYSTKNILTGPAPSWKHLRLRPRLGCGRTDPCQVNHVRLKGGILTRGGPSQRQAELSPPPSNML